jgi:predicted transcriptional regulator
MPYITIYGILQPYMEKTTIYLPDEMQHSLAILAKRQQRPQASIIREAIAAYLEKQRPVKLRSIGAGSDDEVTGASSEDWLRKQWRRNKKEK